MKCPNCGCKDFLIESLTTGNGCTEGGAYVPIEVMGCVVEAHICKKCGRIELYSPKAVEKPHYNYEINKELEEAFKEAKEKRITFLKEEKERLEVIINDENQTVKAVEEAKHNLDKVNKELRRLQRNSHGV